GLPVEVGTGGRTKRHRTTRELPKAHWIDAACVGASTPETIRCVGVVPCRSRLLDATADRCVAPTHRASPTKHQNPRALWVEGVQAISSEPLYHRAPSRPVSTPGASQCALLAPAISRQVRG